MIIRVHLKYGDESLIEVKNIEDVTFIKIFEDFDNLKSSLKSILVSNERFDEIATLKFDEKYKLQLEELYKTIKGDDDYKFIYNAILKDSVNIKEYIYNISIKNNHELKFYNLKFCDQNYKCRESIKVLYSTEKSNFKKVVNSLIKDLNKEYQEFDEDFMAELYILVKGHNEKSIIKEASKPFNHKIDSLVQAIENLQAKYSGKLKLNKTIRTYKKADDKKKNKEKTSLIVSSKEFEIDYATIRFFNNKAKEVVIVGALKDDVNREFVSINVQHSIPLRSFNNSKQYVPVSPNDEDANRLFINYNDLFQYYPYENTFNYSVRNSEYRIEADSVADIEEKKLMDYFTAIVFSDFLGLNDNNANSLLQAEGRIKMPLWIYNFKKVSLIHSLYADVNATIYNGFDDNSRFISPKDVVLDSSDPNVLNSVTINNFDYIKNNNLNVGLGLNFLNLELKGLSTEWSFGYGLRYYRAGLKYTSVTNGLDDVKRYQLNALSHEFSTNFEIRPQLNFGADLNIAFNWLNGRGADENINILYNPENDNDKKGVMRLQLNLYSKVNPNESNGGIYGRIGGFYHFGAKDFYPQILVGYATNLSSFVNKFAKK